MELEKTELNGQSRLNKQWNVVILVKIIQCIFLVELRVFLHR